jgi:hypothetical protein
MAYSHSAVPLMLLRYSMQSTQAATPTFSTQQSSSLRCGRLRTTPDIPRRTAYSHSAVPLTLLFHSTRSLQAAASTFLLVYPQLGSLSLLLFLLSSIVTYILVSIAAFAVPFLIIPFWSVPPKLFFTMSSSPTYSLFTYALCSRSAFPLRMWYIYASTTVLCSTSLFLPLYSFFSLMGSSAP